MNQKELRQMAEERIRDAETLIAGSRWEFAYYTAGYAVECALKSCVLARMVVTGRVFDEQVKKVDEYRTHEFRKLILIAGLKNELDEKLGVGVDAANEFRSNWNAVEEWKVTSRYEAKSEAEAKRLLAAINDQPHGVFEWLRNYW